MSFGDAFQYPFSSGKFSKIAQIALVFGIISALQIGMSFDAEFGTTNGIAMLVGGIGSILFSLFLSGYGTFVIQNVAHNNLSLPEFQIGSSIKRGFQIGLASIVYLLPVIIFMVIIFALFLGPVVGDVFNEITYALDDPSYVPSDSSIADGSAMFGLVMCGAMLVFIPVMFILSYALQIGMVRFGIEERSGALWEFGTNFKMVTSNFGKVMKLFLLQIGVGIVFAIIGGVIALIYGFAVGTMSSIGFMFVIFAIYGVVGSYFNIANQLSNLYLLAGFAKETGLAGGKAKNDDSFDTAFEF